MSQNQGPKVMQDQSQVVAAVAVLLRMDLMLMNTITMYDKFLINTCVYFTFLQPGVGNIDAIEEEEDEDLDEEEEET